MISFIYELDKIILFFIQNNFRSPMMDRFMIFITSLGDSGIIWIAISLLLMINKKYRMLGFMSISVLILSSLFSEVIFKELFQRQRPFIDFPSVNILVNKPISYSFPSGHTSLSFGMAGIISKRLNKISIVFYGLASLIAFSRMYLFLHYPTDILGGIILGLTCAMGIDFIYNIIKDKWRRI